MPINCHPYCSKVSEPLIMDAKAPEMQLEIEVVVIVLGMQGFEIQGAVKECVKTDWILLHFLAGCQNVGAMVMVPAVVG